MYQMTSFIDTEHSLCLPLCFCFYQIGLCSVSHTANEYSIYHFRIIIKDFFISFSRVIIVQDFETVTFDVLFVYNPTFFVIFCFIKRVRVSRKFSSLFILFISTAKPISLVYWSEDKQTRHLVSFDPASFKMSKICEGNFQSYAVWHSYFSIPRQSFHRKRAKSLEEFFFSFENAIWSILLKYQEIDVQIQAFTDENWNILHSCFFERY